MAARACLTAVCAMALALAFAACGSSKTTTTNTVASRSPARQAGSHSPAIEKYVGAVNALCKSTGAKLQSLPKFPYPNFDPTHPDKTVMPKIGRFFAQNSVPVFQDTLTKLEALHSPPATRTAAQSLTSDLKAYVSNLQAQVRSAEASNTSAFVATVNAFSPLQSHLSNDFATLGATTCNSLFSGG